MTKRVLTLLIEYENDKIPEWIWHTHLHNKPINGIFIKGIYEGNQIDPDFEFDEEEK